MQSNKPTGLLEERKAVLIPRSAVYVLVGVTKGMACCLPEQPCPLCKPDQMFLPFSLSSLVTLM